MSEDRLNPELHTTRELLYNEVDGTWYRKFSKDKSEVGGYLSFAAGGASGDFSSQLTETKLLTGVGTLSSAGMKFHLKDIVVNNDALALNTMVVMDGTATQMVYTLSSGAANVLTHLQDIVMHRFSSDCRLVFGTGPVHVTVGGWREVLAR